MTVREELPGDAVAVRRVVEHAFGQTEEAELVERLRRVGAVTAACVAEWERDTPMSSAHQIVGHILFSPVTIAGRRPPVAAVGLGPLAVAPEHQRQGVGTALVEWGLARCRDRGVGLVVVLGHPAYYPRFGFRPAHRSGLTCEYDVPPGTFMVRELEAGALDACSGLVRYHVAFSDV